MKSGGPGALFLEKDLGTANVHDYLRNDETHLVSSCCLSVTYGSEGIEIIWHGACDGNAKASTML
jgi:hypothetical protein